MSRSIAGAMNTGHFADIYVAITRLSHIPWMRPLASSPFSAGIIICPKLSASSRFFFVEGCAY
ncbi:hypothetical protein BOQ60_24760, partial [Chryseobacterium sp. CH1]